ncbi:MAG TPA: hypothetical protein VGS19_27440 [Streptosporangiaceae bacterium]|nr:hypothetical protein [Streptosporangiaceae bacterium]
MMRWQSGVAAAAGTATAAGLLAVISVVNHAPPPVSAWARQWGQVTSIPRPATFGKSLADQRVSAMSCAAPGECGVGGNYKDSGGHLQAFVAAEHHGTWADAQPVAGVATLNTGLNATIVALSCAAPGDCSAVGTYFDSSHNLWPFVVSETHGRWSAGAELSGIAALNSGGDAALLTISCTAPDDCAAGGSYTHGFYDTSYPRVDALVATETNGRWNPALEVPGIAALNFGEAAVTSVSCTSPGDCGAGGYYSQGNGAGGQTHAFTVMQTNGSWASAEKLHSAEVYASVLSVSCVPGGCAAGGYEANSAYLNKAFTASERGGSWGSAEAVPGISTLSPRKNSEVDWVSCASVGDCGAGGSYNDETSDMHAFVISETGGTWGAAQTAPGPAPRYLARIVGIAGPGLVLCPPKDECVATGS